MISFVKWCEHFITLPTGKPIRFEPHQKRILDHVFTFGADGMLPYQVIVYACPKKSGKTALNALVKGYWAFNVEAPNEVITVANKRDQAVARAFKELKGFISRSPVLSSEVVSITGNQITLKNGTTLSKD